MRKALLVIGAIWLLVVWFSNADDRDCAADGAGPAYYNGAGEFEGCLEPE